jgi:predicted amidohydrolase YtcJ
MDAAPGLSAHTVKIFMDGVVNAPADTGALLTPYFKNDGSAQAPHWVPGSNLGELYYPPDKLRELLDVATDAGMDVHIHATGERAVRQALDGIEAVRHDRPTADIRPSIAHAETVAVADYPRFAALDTTATISFQWAQRASYSIGDTEHHLGADRFARMEPFGSLHRAGARIAYGSDWPVDPYDIFLALSVGVTRAGDPANPHSPASQDPAYVGRINADPVLSRREVLRAATLEGAHQLRMERLVGSIEVGKLADLIVLDRDFMTIDDSQLGRTRVLLTMVGGRVVMDAGELRNNP